MVTPTAIDLSTTTLTTDAISLEEQFATVEVNYSGVDGDFDVIPLQNINGTVYNPIIDYHGNQIIWHIRPLDKGNRLKSGIVTFNITPELYSDNMKLECYKVTGRMGATVGTVQFYVKNTA